MSRVARRELLKASAAVVAGALARAAFGLEPEPSTQPIIDSHIHVWDLKRFRLPWLDGAEALLKHDYSVADYRDAIRGTGIAAAVYVEVEVEADQRVREAEYANQLAAQPKTLIPAAVIGGDPADPGLEQYINRFKDAVAIKGVRCPYPSEASENKAFVSGIRALGAAGMSFDLLAGASELADAAKLVEACPQTKFILDHCGGGEARLFRKSANPEATQRRETWKQGIATLAKRENVACKISGVADSALPGEATANDCAPIVNFCLDQFGTERVLFGTNWPVCLKGTTIQHWVESLNQIVATRPAAERAKLFGANARRVYRLAN